MIKEKLQSAWAWTKRQWKKIVTVFTVGVVLAAGIPAVLSNNSFENLPNVAKEAGLYRIKVDKYTEIEIPETTKPEATLRKWGDETFIRVWYDDIEASNSKQENGKLKWQGNTKEVHLYEIEDGFEFEVILKEKPESNIIELGIESKGLEFYYQPELTQKEIDEGAERPENVVGSYAVYHESKKGDYSKMAGKNYRAGKAFHIYRPQMEDANGWKVWGELFIDAEKEIHNVTIPEDFWQNAQYPVRHASGEVFGNEGAGSSSSAIFTSGNSWRYGNEHSPEFDGTVDSIHASIDVSASGVSTVKAAINQKDSVEVGSHGEIVIVENTISNSNKHWEIFTCGDEAIYAANTYILNALGWNSYGIAISFYYDAADPWIDMYGEINTYASPESPWVETSYSQPKEYSIYATYTPAAPPSEEEPPPNNSQIIGYNK